MQYKAFMIKYAEIGTKGKNRYIFEDILCKNINRKLKPYGDFYIRKEQGRIFVECKSDYDYEDVVNALGKYLVSLEYALLWLRRTQSLKTSSRR